VGGKPRHIKHLFLRKVEGKLSSSHHGVSDIPVTTSAIVTTITRLFINFATCMMKDTLPERAIAANILSETGASGSVC